MRTILGSVVIASRFNGPPASGNGGYVAGRLAAFVDAPAVTVRLAVPPPLETELGVHDAGDGAVELRDGDQVIASARAGELVLEVPATVDLETAAHAAATTPLRPERHPYPTCFGCGPQREAGDALRHICGFAADGLAACPATTDARLPHDEHGHLLPEIVWSALDCPSATPVIAWDDPPHVLGTFTVRIDRPVAVGEPHVCIGWPLAIDGRKKRSASALLDADGETVAMAEALWIEVRR